MSRAGCEMECPNVRVTSGRRDILQGGASVNPSAFFPRMQTVFSKSLQEDKRPYVCKLILNNVII